MFLNPERSNVTFLRTQFLLKPVVLRLGPRWRIQWYVRIYQRRDETGSLCRPDLYSSTRCIIPYIYGLELSSLYTCNTSWCSVHYMILNKPLVRLTTAHYQSAVNMISFAQVLTAQWSDTIPCQNVQFQVGIISHNIPFQQFPWTIITRRYGIPFQIGIWVRGETNNSHRWHCGDYVSQDLVPIAFRISKTILKVTRSHLKPWWCTSETLWMDTWLYQGPWKCLGLYNHPL